MKTVYLDNAATTPMLPEVIEVMQESMQNNFGNPSSIHQFGRKAKAAIETARKNIAKHFNVAASEIIFTAGGTEADNLILQNAVINLGVKRIITSQIEHHAVLHTVEYLQKKHQIFVDFVKVDQNGVIQLDDLELLLNTSEEKTLVSLMYVNNEIGNLLPIAKVSEVCQKYNAYFHSDTVQAIGYYAIDLQKTPLDFMVASAHKFHGPKGVGFAYVKKGIPIRPMLFGGGQEKGARSGTENIHAILGMEKALAIAYNDMLKNKRYISELKSCFINGVQKSIKEVEFNGLSGSLTNSSCAIVNVLFPSVDKMMLFNLDLKGVSVSGGSACQSGANKGSHVLLAMLKGKSIDRASIRFSFSKLTNLNDVHYVVNILVEMFKNKNNLV